MLFFLVDVYSCGTSIWIYTRASIIIFSGFIQSVLSFCTYSDVVSSFHLHSSCHFWTYSLAMIPFAWKLHWGLACNQFPCIQVQDFVVSILLHTSQVSGFCVFTYLHWVYIRCTSFTSIKGNVIFIFCVEPTHIAYCLIWSIVILHMNSIVKLDIRFVLF